MTDSFVYQLSVSIPSGQQYEKGDMLNIRGNDPVQFNAALDAFNEELAAKCAGVASAVKIAYGYQALGDMGGTRVPDEPAQQQPQQNPWGNQQQNNQPPPQQSQQQGGGNRFGGTPHPEGKACSACNKVLEMKKTSSGKTTWRCPDWRWNNGNPNNHDQEWG